MAEEAPPPAFYVESNPRSIYMPANSFQSVDAEVFEEHKKVSSVQSPNSYDNISPVVSPPLIRNAMHLSSGSNGGLGINQMIGAQAMVNGMAPNQLNQMDFGILSRDFMQNMMNMAVSMDMDQMKEMNQSLQHDLQSMNSKSLNPYHQSRVNQSSRPRHSNHQHAPVVRVENVDNIPNLPPQGALYQNSEPNPRRRRHHHSLSNPNFPQSINSVLQPLQHHQSLRGYHHQHQMYSAEIPPSIVVEPPKTKSPRLRHSEKVQRRKQAPESAHSLLQQHAQNAKLQKQQQRGIRRKSPKYGNGVEFNNPRKFGDEVEFSNPVQRELVTMGFDREYVVRSTNLYRYESAV